MLAEAGVPDMTRQDIPSELLQPLVPRYEEALSQLERAVKVRGRGVPDPCLTSGKTEQQRAGRGECGRAGRGARPGEEGWGQSCTQVSAGPCCAAAWGWGASGAGHRRRHRAFASPCRRRNEGRRRPDGLGGQAS